jgi:signal peptidase II
MMKKLVRFGLVFITILSCVGCDQTTKYGAQSLLQGQSPISFLGGIFNFTYAENTGAMLSFGGALPEHYRFVLFVLLVSVFLVSATLYLLAKPHGKITTIALSLIVGGGLGNLIDRVFNNGAVVDFMLIKIGSLQTGIFNVADIAITFGALALCLTVLHNKREST